MPLNLPSKFIFTKTEVINDAEKHFLLLHHLKIVNQNYFRNEEEFMFIISKNKYSIFQYLDQSFLIDNKYFFLMEYPEVPCRYYFDQNTNPLDAPSDADVSVNIRNQTCIGDVTFSGLTRAISGQPSILDGALTIIGDILWFFPIGQMGSWGSNQIPAFTRNTNPKIIEVNLWIQIKNPSIIARLSSDCSHLRIYIKFKNLPLFFVIITSKI